MADHNQLPDDDELLTDIIIAGETLTPQSRWQKARLTGDGPPFIKIGHLVRYRRRDFREWLESQPRVTSTSELAACPSMTVKSAPCPSTQRGRAIPATVPRPSTTASLVGCSPSMKQEATLKVMLVKSEGGIR